jgi:hypothetical protein
LSKLYMINNHTRCSDIRMFDGCVVSIKRELFPPEVDEEVRPMYEVETWDGSLVHVFPDELYELKDNE